MFPKFVAPITQELVANSLDLKCLVNFSVCGCEVIVVFPDWPYLGFLGMYSFVVVISIISAAMARHTHGPLTRYAKLRVAHAPAMPGMFSSPVRVNDPDMHHGTCLTHVPGCLPGSLTCGFLWSRWRGKRSRHPRRMRNPQFCVSCMKPMGKRNCTVGILDMPIW